MNVSAGTCSAKQSEAIETIDPTTGQRLERYSLMGASELDARLEVASACAIEWSSTPFEQRAALLRAIAARLRVESDMLAFTAAREMGKPIVQARAEVEKCAWALEYFVDHGSAMLNSQMAESSARRSYVAFRPLGVLLAIMSWNFPYWQVIRAAAPALMAGNSVVLKHAPNTTRCALELERVFADAGAPPGLYGTLIVGVEAVGKLVADHRVAAVTFTGGERAGVVVAAAAGSALKKCVLELGGCDPFVVLADADLETVAKIAVAARFQNNGQDCIAAKRFIVEGNVYDEFLHQLRKLVAEQVVGDPIDERTQLGPCAREDVRATVQDQVQRTLAAGGRLIVGGEALGRTGYFYAPTIVADVTPGMSMFDEEVFGPAAAVVRAQDREDAIALANQSAFGLGASLWTRDVAAAEALVPRIQAGMVFINEMVASDPRLPFGGVKKSGYGRELSRFGIREFVNVQTVCVSAGSWNVE